MRWAAALDARVKAESVSDFLRLGERAASRVPRLRLARRALKFARGAAVGGAAASDAWRYDLTAKEARLLLRADLRPAANQISPTCLAWNHDLPPVDALRLADIEVLLRDEMLPKLDRAGMAFGLEGRPPLLDDDFVAAMMAVPVECHLAHRGGKALLRRWAVELCPVVDDARPKHGFDVPMDLWLRGPLRDDVERLLLDPGRHGLTDTGQAKRAWTRMTAGTPGSAHTLFAMLVAELWHEESERKAA